MSAELKQFLEALNAASGKTLHWHGSVPKEIRDITNIGTSTFHFTYMGVRVEIKPKYVVVDA